MLLNPVKKITNEAVRFAQENVKAGEKLIDVIRNKDEIGLLAGSVDQMEEQIENYVDNLEKITAEKEKIGQAAIRNVKDQFTKQIMCDKTIAVYNELMNMK